MYTCMVCGNSGRETKIIRPDVVYHKFPKNENLRKKWLENLGIDYCSKWQCVCSDHFLEVNYKPGMKRRLLFRNTVPQVYLKKSNQNGFPYNYTIQINDVETGNNAVLPMEQNIIVKEKDIGNTAVNNFKTQRRTVRKMKSTRINDDMNYYEYLPRPEIEERQIPAVIETDVRPVLSATKVDKICHTSIDDIPNMDSRLKEKLKTISIKNSLTITLEATSTLKMQDKLSSNTVICPEFIENQVTFSKCIPPKNKSNSSKLEDIYGFIFEISKMIILPSIFWKSTHFRKKNTTVFRYRGFFENAEKQIYFYNSLVPVIQLYGKNYKYNERILSKHQLENLLKKINGFEKCSGGYGFVYQKCIGYFDGSSEDTEMCSACQEWVTKASETIKCLESKIAKRKSVVMKLREQLQLKEKVAHLEN